MHLGAVDEGCGMGMSAARWRALSAQPLNRSGPSGQARVVQSVRLQELRAR